MGNKIEPIHRVNTQFNNPRKNTVSAVNKKQTDSGNDFKLVLKQAEEMLRKRSK